MSAMTPSDPKPGAPRYVPASYPPRKCKLCGGDYQPHRADQGYCCAEHRIAYNALASRRGLQVYDALIRWRKSRGKKKGLLGDITHIIDGWIDEDRSATKKE
jgi:hypothetical protein